MLNLQPAAPPPNGSFDVGNSIFPFPLVSIFTKKSFSRRVQKKFKKITLSLISAVETPSRGSEMLDSTAKIYHRLIPRGALTLVLLVPVVALADADAERIARLEQRLLELEQRLDSQEEETKEAKVMAASSAASGGASSNFSGNPLSLDIMAGSAWRNLRWTQKEQWEGIRKGISEERVIELLGSPPRSLDSLKPRIDKVFWYETSLRDRSSALRGKISFKDGKVYSFKPPNFQAVKQAMQAR
jgi:hypothetical protein